MKKLFSLFYSLCWVCLGLGVFAAFPAAPTPAVEPAGKSLMPAWMPLLLGLLILLMLFILLERLMKSTASSLRTFGAGLGYGLLIFGAWGGGQWIRHRGPAVAAQWSGTLGVGMLVLLILFMLVLLVSAWWGQRQNKTAILWQTVLLLAAVIGVTLLVPGMWGLSLPTVTLPGDLLSYYMGQLSLTFITISVMSVLSDKSVIIYWENIAEAKLVRPMFGSFAACTAYSVVCAVGAGISVLLDNALAFVVFLSLNVVTLIVLTLTMVDVYFNREQKRQRLEARLQRAKPRERTDMMHQLRQHLHQAMESHDLLFVREVAELYGGYLPLFDCEEGRKIRQLLDTADLDIPAYVGDGVERRVAQLKQKHDGRDVLVDNTWYEDASLWSLLAKVDAQDAYPLLRARAYRAVRTRMALVVFDVLCNSARLYQYESLPYQRIVAMIRPPYRMTSSVRRKVQRNFNNFVRICGLMQSKSENTEKTLLEKLKSQDRELNPEAKEFLTNLLRVALRVAQPDGEQKPWLQNHPLLIGLENHLHLLDLTEEEITALRQYID